MYFKPHDIRILMTFIFVILALYVFFVFMLSFGISKLNTARDEELKAATMQYELAKKALQGKTQ